MSAWKTSLAEALELRAHFLEGADAEDWREEVQSSVSVMRHVASELRKIDAPPLPGESNARFIAGPKETK